MIYLEYHYIGDDNSVATGYVDADEFDALDAAINYLDAKSRDGVDEFDVDYDRDREWVYRENGDTWVVTGRELIELGAAVLADRGSRAYSYWCSHTGYGPTFTDV